MSEPIRSFAWQPLDIDDLISKELLLKEIDEVIAQYNWEDDGVIMDILECVRDMVCDQPTAYNINKVVKQLEKVSFVDIDEEYADDGQRMLFLHDAIEIVKRGGAKGKTGDIQDTK